MEGLPSGVLLLRVRRPAHLVSGHPCNLTFRYRAEYSDLPWRMYVCFPGDVCASTAQVRGGRCVVAKRMIVMRSWPR